MELDFAWADRLADAFGLAQQWLFEQVVQPVASYASDNTDPQPAA
jgi:hypothetical protein